MMVQMVDTVSWLSALIRETEAWRSNTSAFRNKNNRFSDSTAVRLDITAVKERRMESFGDV